MAGSNIYVHKFTQSVTKGGRIWNVATLLAGLSIHCQEYISGHFSFHVGEKQSRRKSRITLSSPIFLFKFFPTCLPPSYNMERNLLLIGVVLLSGKLPLFAFPKVGEAANYAIFGKCWCMCALLCEASVPVPVKGTLSHQESLCALQRMSRLCSLWLCLLSLINKLKCSEPEERTGQVTDSPFLLFYM